VADRKRRGEDAAEDRLDELFDDAVDDDGADEDDDTEEPVSRGGTATRSRKKAAAAADRPAKEKKDAVKTKKDTARGGGWLFGWIGRFVREVIAEMRKVIWPTRKELLTYTAVVVVFVTVITAVVGGLDYVFAKGALWVFGSK
jgi:preprotein translocase subunit SecE